MAAFEVHGLNVEHNLQPGVSEERLDELGARLGVDLPEPFRNLYRWRNGHVDPDIPDVLAFRDNVFLRIEDIPKERDQILDTYGMLWNGPDVLMPEVDPSLCVPIAENWGAVYALVCGPHELTDRSPYPILSFFQGVDLFFYSVESMIETCIEWVEQPGYRHHEEAPNEMEIWLRHNPGVFGRSES